MINEYLNISYPVPLIIHEDKISESGLKVMDFMLKHNQFNSFFDLQIIIICKSSRKW